ncbi:MAG: transglycosylase domain-containing protein [Clostridia bacterium]|nr:transglycosylase domain-containing protein [Clostridia bacterium]
MMTNKTKQKRIRIIWLCVTVIVLLPLLFVISFFAYSRSDALTKQIDYSKLSDEGALYEFYDLADNALPLTNAAYTEFDKLPHSLIDAFISIEDKRYFTHNGFSLTAIARATLNNLKRGGLYEGGSTITQQLVKNVYLSSEKTFKRKLKELAYAVNLEKNLSKPQIMEYYLNCIYFGGGAYGVGNAASRYFDKSVAKLTLDECALLAGLVKAPSSYAPTTDIERCIGRRNTVLREMLSESYITQEQFQTAVEVEYDFDFAQKTPNRIYTDTAAEAAYSILSEKRSTLGEYKVFTYFDSEAQRALCEAVSSIMTDEYSTIALSVANSDGGIRGMYARCRANPLTVRRMIGSTAKPIAVYAPLIEENHITQLTPFEDEPVTIGGYSPKNYNDAYYGTVTAKKALSLSLNSVAVRALNQLTPQIAGEYLTRNGIPLTKSDNSLALALGGLTEGVTPVELTQAYSTFARGGTFLPSSFIRSIYTKSGICVYKNNAAAKRVFSEDTSYILTDMLADAVRNGTAKQLKANFDVAGKTGTVGAASDGNTDAIFVSYTSESTSCFWCFAEDRIMSNSITGGTLPVRMASVFYNTLYEKHTPSNFIKPDSVLSVCVDKVELMENLRLFEVDPLDSNAILGLFRAANRPKKQKTLPSTNDTKTDPSNDIRQTPPHEKNKDEENGEDNNDNENDKKEEAQPKKPFRERLKDFFGY